MYSRIVISSGHGKYVRGASGVLDEVDEARRVVEHLADELTSRGVAVTTFNDDISTTQNDNLNRIVNFHNSKQRDLDVSVHFNAFDTKAHGVEVCYVTQHDLAAKVASAIAGCGFTDRGPKPRSDLFFLNNTEMPAILIETCFCDNQADADVYRRTFDGICSAIADVLGGDDENETVPPPTTDVAGLHVAGKCSEFGGPDDTGVSPSEGLAFLQDVMDAPQLFLPYQPDGTSGLARRLNPFVHYIACRWDYAVTSKEMLASGDVALVKARKTGMFMTAFPADWGPHVDTGRVADLSPGLMDDLGITTDDEVEVTYPWRVDT